MSSSYAPCAACKYLRRKCTQECVFAPYFPPDNPQKFINVHKVFGASNVGKILNELNPTQRNDAVHSLAYEAESRIKDPIYGCVGYVSILQHHLRQVQQEIDRAKKELATYIGPAAMQPILNSPAHLIQLQQQQQNFDPSSLYNNNNQLMAGAYQQGQLMIQEPPHQEMLRAYAQQQQQEQQQQHMFAQQQQQELYAQQQQQQQRMYVQQQQQQQFNDGFVQMEEQPALALGGSFEAHYNQTPEEEEDQKVNSHHHQQQHNQQQFQIQELLLQSPQHLQLMPQQYGAVIKRDGSEEEEEGQGEVEEGDEGRSFGPL